MKTATITYTKNKLSALLALVRNGETIIVMDRGRPVARLEPAMGHQKEYAHGRLKRLERQGLISIGGHPLKKGFSKLPLPKPSQGGDVLKELLKERAAGR
jgi:antitoxin (DNA-binding transcriptional repressor) of toxin-antitoxin stability system